MKNERSSSLSAVSVKIVLIITLFVRSSSAQSPFKYTGYVNVNETGDSNMFYWFFEAQDSNASAPLILYLQGGPGCSGSMALFSENGPYYLTTDLQVVENPFTWTKHYHMIFVDNPVGTGFSYTQNNGYVTNMKELATDLYSFLVYFFTKLFPKFASNDFYIFGESEAGYYTPSLATLITQMNSVKGSIYIPLKGLGIGNGIVDPLTQIPGVLSSLSYATGLIDLEQTDVISYMENLTVQAILKGDYITALNLWNNLTLQVMEWSGMVNPADIRLYGFSSFDVYDTIQSYLTQPEILSELKIPSFVNFTMINQEVATKLQNVQMIGVRDLFPPLLDSGLKIMFFNGNFDMTIPIAGTENFLRSLQWEGQLGWLNTTRQIWYSNSTNPLPSGYIKQYKNLSLITVVQAGHMSIMNQPERTLDMATRFIENIPFF